MRRHAAFLPLGLLPLGLSLLASPVFAEAPPPPAPSVILVRLDPVTGCQSAERADALACLVGSAFPPAPELARTEEELRQEGQYAELAGALWVRLLEDLTISWGDKTSPTSLTLGKVLKATQLPEDIWDTGAAVQGRGRGLKIHSVPATSPRWVGLQGDGALFTQVQWQAEPDGDLPRMDILSGRFADRMAASGAPVSSQLLGADPESGKAFYQQMFPVSPEAQATGFPVQALEAFSAPPDARSPWWDCADARIEVPDGVAPSDRMPIQLSAATLGCAQTLAGEHARRFFQQLGEATLRFGLPGTLPAQLRVLTAANGMVAPPGRYTALAPVQLDDLVVASQGQLDPASMRGVPQPPPGPPGALTIDYAALPEVVVLEALAARIASPRAEALAVATLNARLSALFAEPSGDTLGQLAVASAARAEALKRDPLGAQTVDPPAPFTSLAQDPETAKVAPLTELCPRDGGPPGVDMACRTEAVRAALEAWALPNAQPGRQTSLLATLPWWALSVLVQAEPADAVARSQRALLLDQLRVQLYATLDPARLVAPKDQIGVAEKLWASTLSDHGVNITGLPQAGPRMVDPTAVCTQGSGAEALGEAVNGQVHLDLYFVVDELPSKPEDGLWAQRERLPWIAVDDPTWSAPEVEAVDVVLPGGGLVYRARWQVWTGWHLLWRASEGATEDRVALSPFFGAVCSDLALVQDELLPGLVRAALRGEGPDAVRAAVLGPLRGQAPEGGGAVVALADLRLQDYWHWPVRLFPKEPMARRQARALRDAETPWLGAEGQALLLSANPKADDVPLAPDLVALPTPPAPPPGTPPELASRIEDARTVRYRSAIRVEAWTDVGLGWVFGMPSASGSGPALDLRLGAQSWLASAPRLGWVIGGGAQLLGLPTVDASRSSSPFPGFELPAASGVAYAGLRLAPLPPTERPASRGVAWGDSTAGGEREIRRLQLGLLGVGAAGDGQDGRSLRAIWLEPWLAWSLVPEGTRRQSLQAYQPGLLLGLYGRIGGEQTTDTSTCAATLGDSACLWGGAGLRLQMLGKVGKKP